MTLPNAPIDGPWPTAHTRLFLLFGDPVKHSLSPAIHNAAFRHDGIDAVYLTFRTDRDRFAATVATCVKAGVAGANVTVPHKQAAFQLADTLSADAQLIGAVNTLVFQPDGRIVGENTDVGGFGDDLDTFGITTRGTSAVVFGTGGAARACVVALGRRNMAVTVLGRTAERADELAELATEAGASAAHARLIDDPAAAGDVAGAAVVINATVLGLNGEDLPTVITDLAADQLAYDLIYNPPVTPFLAVAAQRGAATQNGLPMLINQAARAYSLFTGRDAPWDVMADAVTRTLS